MKSFAKNTKISELRIQELRICNSLMEDQNVFPEEDLIVFPDKQKVLSVAQFAGIQIYGLTIFHFHDRFPDDRLSCHAEDLNI